MRSQEGPDMTMQWYVVEAFEGKDFDVALRLAAAGFNVWRPVDVVRSGARWNGRKIAGNRRLVRKVARFGRYLFVELEMTDAVRWAISTTPGVFGFICFAGVSAPAIVPRNLIEFYRENLPERGACGKEVHKGDRIKIKDGPFAFCEGVVEDVDKRGILRVTIYIFGGPTPLIIEVGHVELVELGRRPPIGLTVKSALRTKVGVSA
jgi:transcription antitermination factor NusG